MLLKTKQNRGRGKKCVFHMKVVYLPSLSNWPPLWEVRLCLFSPQKFLHSRSWWQESGFRPSYHWIVAGAWGVTTWLWQPRRHSGLLRDLSCHFCGSWNLLCLVPKSVSQIKFLDQLATFTEVSFPHGTLIKLLLCDTNVQYKQLYIYI